MLYEIVAVKPVSRVSGMALATGAEEPAASALPLTRVGKLARLDCHIIKVDSTAIRKPAGWMTF